MTVVSSDISKAQELRRRLEEELEQVLVSREKLRKEVDRLRNESVRLRQMLAMRSAGERAAEASKVELRAELSANVLALSRMRRDQATEIASHEELQVAMEELHVVAEELAEANDALRRMNEELDRRVALRTAELAQANAELNAVNASLQRRVQEEVEAREEAQARVFQNQKMEALGQLTGGVAHDFNNLLTVVMNCLQLMARAETPERRAQLIERIERAAQRAVTLTQRLLVFARRQPLRPTTLDTPSFFANLQGMIASASRKDLETRIEPEPDVWPVLADANALELAILNLVVNARDALADGGHITIIARNRSVAADAAEEMSIKRGDYVEIAVNDNGRGMPPEVLDRVFEPFFTTKKSGEGTGLGLPQVYGFARQSNGAIRIESAPGEGTTVAILLPRARKAAEAQPGSQSIQNTASACRILIVEDDQAVGQCVMEMLAEMGHHPHWVSSAVEALATLQGEFTPDLVLTDMMLSGGRTGLDLRRDLIHSRPGLPVLLTTGYVGNLPAQHAAEGLPLLRKPYHPEALQAAIASVMARAH